jgi:hypothetical protein
VLAPILETADDNGWTCTRPSAEGLPKVPLGGCQRTRPRSQKGNQGVDKSLAEPDPPSKYGIRMGGPVPDLYVALSGVLLTGIERFSGRFGTCPKYEGHHWVDLVSFGA